MNGLHADLCWIDDLASEQAIVPDATPVVTGRRLHVDGDMMAYLAGGGQDASVETSRNMFWGKLNSMRRAAGTDEMVMHLTVSGCLKGNRPLYSVTQPYQHQRVGKVKPKNWAWVRDYMEAGHADFKNMRWADREADDGLGFAARANELNVITSGDKDLQTKTGWHCDWVEPELFYVPHGTYEFIGPRDKMYGDKFLLCQLLHGDDADFIPGMGKGYGPAYAKKVLAGTTCKEEGIEAALREYVKKFGPEAGVARFAEHLFLLYIRDTRQGLDTEWYDWVRPSKYGDILIAAGDAHVARVNGMLEEARIINEQINRVKG